ncbi:SDR family oxidoreductase [Nocardioides sp.]|uniref:SDR family NAD(P)-dependent oxidoreductase n=1 Tax=Nocardioides sp. TaxID=35761 RepID=UPI0026125427|nr:SDR family oxidoreductase [Nocardioides sp.]
MSDDLVLITGAGGGIGAAIARRLVASGRPVALLYRRTRPEALIEELGDAVGFAGSCDLTSTDALAATLESLTATTGAPTAVVHSAGPHVPMVHLSKVSPAQFAEQIGQDLVATFNLAHAVLPALREARGSLTFVTSAGTTRYPVRDGLSSIPKAGVEALARALAAEEGRFGVRVNSVGPGMLTDGMAERLIANGDLDQRALDTAMGNIPLRTFGSADDIAEAVEYLASDRARFVTGQKIDIDGGYGV